MKKLNFQIEVARVLEILSNDIYDSPYALLRENIQNAYDAILMRISEEGNQNFNPKIEVEISDSNISITDNGIGMDEIVLQNNFWKAGSSGKNNEQAKKAGVIGTFGIGAMANFGVATKLIVTTKKLNTNNTIQTFAERNKLSLTEECINFEIVNDVLSDFGTKVEVLIDQNNKLNEQDAKGYLLPYIQYLKIPVIINGENSSQKDYTKFYKSNPETILNEEVLNISLSNFSCQLKYTLNKNSNIKLYAQNIVYNQTPLIGEIILSEGVGNIYGLRNFFGLAPMPIPNNFNFGGIVNLSFLHPTAGREALSRESINLVTYIINILEDYVTDKISKFDNIDNNNYFLNYILKYKKFNLSNNILIDLKPGDEKIKIKDITENYRGKDTYYYGGREQNVITNFANENSYLFNLSQSNPRRSIQLHKLKEMRIKEVPDHPSIIKVFDKKELNLAEVAIILRMSNVLSDDYLLSNTLIQFAEISHNVPNIVKQNVECTEIYLSKSSPNINQLIVTYDNAFEVFEGFIKDYVRNYLYQKIAPYIPSSTRYGADALHKILIKNRELFKYDTNDLGEMAELDNLLNDYISGTIELSEVLKESSKIRKIQTQHVNISQVGNAEDEIPTLMNSCSEATIEDNSTINNFIALPAINRMDSLTTKKILKTNKRYPHLNNFAMFLSLSQRVYKKELEFFLEPHTTKVIWGMHRIVYIFTHASNKLSLYYDIELKERLMNNDTGGKTIPTTTILTDGSIFIPILQELEEYFDITEGTKEFFVRHDIITEFK